MIASLLPWQALTRREIAALVAVFLLSLPAVTPRIYASDEIQYFSYLRSLWFDRDVHFENEYRYFFERGVGRNEGFHETFLERTTEAGRPPNFGTIGSALLWSPFYAIGDLSARLMRAAGREVAVDGFSQPYIAAVAYGSAFYGFAAILLSIAAARRILEAPATRARVPAVAAGVLIWIGTPLLFYMYVAPPYAHACSAFAVALFVTVWLQVRQEWTIGGAIALGLGGALMAMVREQDAFFAAGPAVDFLIAARARFPLPQTIRTTAAGCVAFAAGLLPQLLAYDALNGAPRPSSLVTRKMNWLAPHGLEVLASGSHGFLVWTPLALVAVAGLAALAMRGPGHARTIARCALLMVALQVYVGGSVESWTVAGAFGQRRFVALTCLLTVGMAWWLALMSGTRARVASGIALAVCVWWNLALMAQFGTRMMDRQRLEIGRNAYVAFVVLPRMLPSLAWRYLTDRGSFFATGDDRSGDSRGSLHARPDAAPAPIEER